MIMYRQNEIIDSIINRIVSTESPIDMEELATNGCQHYLWTVKDKAVSILMVVTTNMK